MKLPFLKSTEYKFVLEPLVSNDPRIKIGRFTYGKPNITLWSENDSVEIGSFCSFGVNVEIISGGEHRTDWITTYPLKIAFNMLGPNDDLIPFNKGPINIGHDVWVGQGARILSGVRIGNGAVIAAGSLITKDVADYEVVGGNPAKHIKFRFNEIDIQKLLSLKWWGWNIEKIIAQANSLQSDNLKSFFEENT
jgi:acetyltransferase-like isoleucine patch superfamily enzyme